MRNNRKRGRPPLGSEKYYGHNRIRRRLNKLWKPDNQECIAVETYPGENLDRHSEEFLYAPIECIRMAIGEKKFMRLDTGLWYCCMRRVNDDQSRTFCVVYRMAYGKAKPLSNLYEFVNEHLKESQYARGNLRVLDTPNDCPRILKVLPSNISRTFESPNINTRIIPHVGMYTLTKRDTAGSGT